MKRLPPLAALVAAAALSAVPTHATVPLHARHAESIALAQQQAAEPGVAPTGTQPVDRTGALIRRINRVRAAGATCGATAYPAVGPVRRAPLLDRISQSYAARMAERNFFGHIAPDGSDPTSRARDAGYLHPVAEILTAGQVTAASAVAAWRRSPEHCAVLMTGHRVGVGHAKKPRSDYVHYWALNARRPG